MDVCFLTAHPDDESLFFLPTIVNLLQRRIPVHLLCITTGDADGKGSLRRKELLRVSDHLGLCSCTVLDDDEFPDSMHLEWDLTSLRDKLIPILRAHKVATIYTFDEYGISGHQNHRSLGRLATLLCDEFQVFRLKSHSWLWKYCILSKFWTCHDSNVKQAYSLGPFEGIQRVFHCMQIHSSQLVWFRYLYLLFSCYTNKNEYM